MSGPKPLSLAVLMAVLLIASALSVPLKGGLHITHFDGDVLHFADILKRMRAGAVPHVDFMTPVGGLAFAPFAILAKAGFDLGLSFALGQALFAAIAAIWVFRAAATRLPPVTGYVFAAITVLLLMSLSHGATGNLAISMHYNRWAWAVIFAVILLALLPNRSEARPLLDGALIGAGLAALVLLKITYFVAFAPVIAALLLLRREMLMLISALTTGLLLAAILWAVLGHAYWMGYLADLQTVSASELRAAPGQSFSDLIVSPPYLPGTAVLMGAAFLLRRIGQRSMGLGLLLLFPAFTYVTWQNFGNDSIWLILLAVILIAMRPDPDGEGDLPRRAIGVAGVAAAVLAAPIALTHGLSAPRHLFTPTETHVPLVAEEDGIFLSRNSAELIRGRQQLNVPGEVFDVVPDPRSSHTPPRFAEMDLPECEAITGLRSVLRAVAGDLRAGDGPVFVADIISAHWLFGLDALPGGAPWNYGSLSGIESANHLVVPLCPISPRARRVILDALGPAPDVTLVRETPRLRLYRLNN